MKPSPKPEDLALAKRAAEAIRKLYPEAEVILYGSRARGIARPDSDMDLLVLLSRRLPYKEEMSIDRALLPLEYESGLVLCPIIEERDLWYSDKYQAMPVAQTVCMEGLAL